MDEKHPFTTFSLIGIVSVQLQSGLKTGFGQHSIMVSED